MSNSEKLTITITNEAHRVENQVDSSRNSLLFLDLAKLSERAQFNQSLGMCQTNIELEDLDRLRSPGRGWSFSIHKNQKIYSLAGFAPDELRIEVPETGNQNIRVLMSPATMLALTSAEPLLRADTHKAGEVPEPTIIKDKYGVLTKKRSHIAGNSVYKLSIPANSPDERVMTPITPDTTDLTEPESMLDFIQDARAAAQAIFDKILSINPVIPMWQVLAYRELFNIKTANDMRNLPKWMNDCLIFLENYRIHIHPDSALREDLKNAERHAKIDKFNTLTTVITLLISFIILQTDYPDENAVKIFLFPTLSYLVSLLRRTNVTPLYVKGRMGQQIAFLAGQLSQFDARNDLDMDNEPDTEA